MPAIAADGWNHNSHYHAVLLGAAPRPCRRALDVGCGLGSFARRLAAVSDEVHAIDRESAVVRQARALSGGVRRIQFIEADFLSWPGDTGYDFVSMIAVLHHLPFATGLTKAAALLRPGGVLAVLGLHRARSILDAVRRSAMGYPISGYYRCTRRTSHVGAPTRDPSMTLDDIVDQARAILPGSTVQGHLLWRYSLVWAKPEVGLTGDRLP